MRLVFPSVKSMTKIIKDALIWGLLLQNQHVSAFYGITPEASYFMTGNWGGDNQELVEINGQYERQGRAQNIFGYSVANSMSGCHEFSLSNTVVYD